MQLLQPMAAWAALAVPALVLLYLLKQRYEERQVPSIALWKRVMTQWEAAHPWQRWRNTLLFFLQLLALMLMILALMKPVWRTAGSGRNIMVILDASMSMKANENGKTRFEQAKERIKTMIDQLDAHEHMSLIVSGIQNDVIILNESDKGLLTNLLNQIQPENGTNELEQAVLLAQSLQDDENPDAIILLSDQSIVLESEGVWIENMAQGADNVAVKSVSYAKMESGSLRVLGVIQSFSDNENTYTVQLSLNGELADVQDILVPANGMANVIFDDVDQQTLYIDMHIQQEDALNEDNTGYAVVQNDEKYKILLETERNLFLEKAIVLRNDIELYKTAPNENVDRTQYALLIDDGTPSFEMSEHQALWIIAPKADQERFSRHVIEMQDIQTVHNSLADQLFRYVDADHIQIATSSGIVPQGGGMVSLLKSGDDVLMAADVRDDAKVLVQGFDFHDTSLPMQKDFPIFVQNILAWFLPEQGSQLLHVLPGDSVNLALRGDTDRVQIELPDKMSFSEWSHIRFDQTDQLGVYHVVQQAKEDNILSEMYFCVNAPIEESELRTASKASAGDAAPNAMFWRQNNLMPWILLAALILMGTEWWVYYRGHTVSK